MTILGTGGIYFRCKACNNIYRDELFKRLRNGCLQCGGNKWQEIRVTTPLGWEEAEDVADPH